MIKYVLGFLFDEELNRLVLIRKIKPQWQAGKLNGIGGKIEPNEAYLSAMIREFKEETGVEYSNWKKFGYISGDGWVVHLYAGSASNIDEVESTTKEQIEIVETEFHYLDNSNDLIDNLMVLIPAAKFSLQNNRSFVSIGMFYD